MVDWAAKTTQEIQIFVDRCRDQGAFEHSELQSALKELGQRRAKGLNFDKSLAIVRGAAADRRFLSYKDLADESGVEWTSVHYAINWHLWDLVQFAHCHGWPMLSAIVVNKQHQKKGDMNPETLQGFIGAARQLGHRVTDTEAFLKDQQEKVFEWGRRE